MSLDYTLCNTADKLTTALPALRGAEILFLDCEGERLGVRGGKLSLISLGVPTHNDQRVRVYIIDALALGGSGLRPIFTLLSSPDVQKVVFDGRMDQSAFYYPYNRVTMDNVLDLQLADIKSRAGRGDKAKQRRGRLIPYLDIGEVNRNKVLYQDVHKLAGLQQVVREHGVVLQDHASRMKMKAHFDHESWMKRPLNKKYLRYAANDIALIHAVWVNFATKGYITDEVLPAQSLRYARMWIGGNQPRVNDEYKQHALLPLDILGGESSADEQTKRCKGCERELSKGCFSNTAWGSGESRRKCLVCRAIAMRLGGD